MVRLNIVEGLKKFFYDKTEVDSKLGSKADTSYVEANYVTDTELSTTLDSSLAGKANTVHTHEITDVNGLNSKLATYDEALESLVGLTVTIVEELPGTGEEGKLYLVPLEEGSGVNDTYAEYVWLSESSRFEKIGTTAISVSVDAELSSSSTNPVQNKVINAALNNKADSSDVTSLEGTVSTLTTTVNGKVDKSGFADRFTLSFDNGTGEIVLEISEE